MTINLKGDVLAITFAYDPKIVEVVKSVSGRQFNAKLKRWEVPKENVLELLEAFSKCGIRMNITMDVIELAKAAETMIKSVEFAKTTPTSYTGSLPLYDFQKIGASFLMTMPGALLADVPGLGKTIQTIAAIGDLPRNLILCPSSLKYSWRDEIEKWSPGASVIVIDGDKDERKDKWFAAGNKKFTIANYELLLHDSGLVASIDKWSSITCDEATRISNPNAKTTKALKQLVTGKRIALTGTPVSNSPVDLYSILDWLSPGVLGSYFQFLNAYCVREPRFNRIVGFKNLDKLGSVVDRFMLRRTKQEVLKDFPAKTVEDIVFSLSQEEIALYDDIRAGIVAELVDKIGDNSANLGIYPVKMLRLKQCTDYPMLLKPGNEEFDGTWVIKSSKLATLHDLIAPIKASDEKAIVFTQFAEVAKILEKEFPGSYLIHGDVSAEERQRIVNDFNNAPGSDILIMTEAGAYGLNLQSATYVIHYDLPWSVAKLTQREDRAHRIGQDKPVTVYNLIAKDTIDEYVAKVLKQKNKTAVKLLSDEERLDDFGLSREDIKAILRL
jgi:SNF2 family DNA or RNA helicase